jgi:hypothetical protein
MWSLPENCKIVKLYGGATNGFSSTTAGSDYVSCKNAHKVWIVGYTWGTTATILDLFLYEATAVAAATNRKVTATFPIWENHTATTSVDTLEHLADAATLQINPDAGAGVDAAVLFVLEWDPAKHTDGYDCITCVGTTGNAADYIVLLAFIQERYPSRVLTQATAITD